MTVIHILMAVVKDSHLVQNLCGIISRKFKVNLKKIIEEQHVTEVFVYNLICVVIQKISEEYLNAFDQIHILFCLCDCVLDLWIVNK
jgi:hypothetical protein